LPLLLVENDELLSIAPMHLPVNKLLSFRIVYLQDHTYALRRPLSPPPLLTFDIDDVSCNTTVVTSTADNDVWEGSVTRCICGFQHDDGFMICCDQCSYVLVLFHLVRG